MFQSKLQIVQDSSCTSGSFDALLMQGKRDSCRNFRPVINLTTDRRQMMNALYFPFTFSTSMRTAHTLLDICSLLSFIIYGIDAWWMLPLCWLDFFHGHFPFIICPQWNKKFRTTTKRWSLSSMTWFYRRKKYRKKRWCNFNKITYSCVREKCTGHFHKRWFGWISLQILFIETDDQIIFILRKMATSK